MNLPALSQFRMTETWWKRIILGLSGAVILFTVWCLSNGITTIFMHLYYFPIVLLAYRYRWKGFWLAALFPLAYFGLVIVFDAGQAEVILGAFFRVLVFVGIAAVIAYLSDRLARETKAAEVSSELREQYISLAPAIVLVLDREGLITFLNRKGSEILECSSEDVVGKPWIGTFIKANERERVRTVFSGLIDGDSSRYSMVESEVITGTGSVRFIRWYNTLLKDADGSITGTMSYGEDLTEEKKAQDTQGRLQQFQESVIANANVWISVLAPDGSTLLVWNDAAEEISGYKKRDVIGKNTVWKQLSPDNAYRKKVTGEIQRIIRRDTFLENFETEIRCADGTTKTIVWNTRSMRDTGGKITGYIAIGRDISAQKAAESRAAESSRFLAAMIDTLPIPVFFKDIGGRYLGCNPPFEEYIGIKRDQLIGKTAYDISPKDLADKYTASDRQVFDALAPQRYETQVQYADGSRHDVIFYKAPFLNKDGSAAGLIGAFLDISERKRTEEAIRESEEKYRAFFLTSRDCVFITTTDGRWVDFNDVAVELFGYENRADLLKTKISQMYANPDDRAAHIAFIRKNGYSFEYPVDLRKKDGTILHTLITSVARKDAAGTIVGFQGSVRDITERRHSEEALRESEKKFHDIFDTVNDAIELHAFQSNGLPGRYLDVNDVGCRMLHYTRTELLAISPLDIVTDYHNPPLEEIAKELNTKGSSRFETEHRRKDDTIVPVEVNAHVIRLQGQDVVVAVVRDITERKRAEEEIKRSVERFSMVMDSMDALVYVVDMQTYELLFINKYGRDTWGKEIEGKVCWQTIQSGQEGPCPFCTNARLVDDKGNPTGIYNWEFRNTMNGRWYDCRDLAIRWLDGRLVRLEIATDITGRKQSEAALRESRQILEGILNTIPVRVFWKDKKLTYLGCNTPFAHDAGFERPEDVIGKDDYSMGWRDQAELYRADDRAVIESGKPKFMIEEPQTTPAGETIYLLTSKLPLLDARGDAIGVLGTYLDITERKKAEAQLQESRQLFSDIISFLPDPTFVIDKDGTVLAWNRAIELLSGVPAGDIIGIGDYEYSSWLYGKRRPILIDLVLHPDQDAARLNYFNIQWEGRTITAQTEIIAPGNGHMTTLSLVASPLIDSLGKISGAIESMRDITHIKETEAELFRINQNLETIVQERTGALEEEVVQRMRAEKGVQDALSYTRSVIEANPDLMVVLDGTGIVLDVNAAAEILTGIPRGQLIGTQYFRHLVEDGTHTDAFSHLLERGRIEKIIQIPRKDGHITPLAVNATIIAGSTGTDTRIIVAGHDITRQKQDEEAIRTSLDEKVVLLREVHHRVKNNLQIIISLTNLQMRQTDDPRVKLIMSETQNRVRAMSLVHEKLYRSESLSHIDFADYARFLATQLFSFYGTDTRKVRLDLAMGKIMVDINTAVPLGLIMNELISNALKHAFPNGRKGIISISGGENGDLITLVVRDNGIGIPEELDWKNTTSLGMRLVTSLIDQIDGTITLDRNQGTAFTITIRREPATGGKG